MRLQRSPDLTPESDRPREQKGETANRDKGMQHRQGENQQEEHYYPSSLHRSAGRGCGDCYEQEKRDQHDPYVIGRHCDVPRGDWKECKDHCQTAMHVFWTHAAEKKKD
jgi:hypothetical protein